MFRPRTLDISSVRRDLCEFIRDSKALGCWFHWEEDTFFMGDTPAVLESAMSVLEQQGFTHQSTTLYHSVPMDNVGGAAQQQRIGVFLVIQQNLRQTERNPPVDPLALAVGYAIGGVVTVLKQQCFVCRTPCTSLCSGCHRAVYCSRRCQRAHWRFHRCGNPGKTLCKSTR